MPHMTTKEFRIARKMLRQGKSTEEVALALRYRHDPSTIQSKVDHRRLGEKERYQRMAPAIPMRISIIPAVVMERREHRSTLKPQSLTAFLCGDPLPGFSALDRRTEVA